MESEGTKSLSMDMRSEKDMLEWIAAEIERMVGVMSGLEEQVTAQKKEELSKTGQSATVDQQVHYFLPAPPSLILFLLSFSLSSLSFPSFLLFTYPPSSACPDLYHLSIILTLYFSAPLFCSRLRLSCDTRRISLCA